MFSSVDILQDALVRNVWKIGVSECKVDKDEIMKYNINKIAEDIISNKESISFRNSGILLKGACVIYYKKTGFVLNDSRSIIERITAGNTGKNKGINVADENIDDLLNNQQFFENIEILRLDEDIESIDIEERIKQINDEIDSRVNNDVNTELKDVIQNVEKSDEFEGVIDFSEINIEVNKDTTNGNVNDTTHPNQKSKHIVERKIIINDHPFISFENLIKKCGNIEDVSVEMNNKFKLLKISDDESDEYSEFTRDMFKIMPEKDKEFYENTFKGWRSEIRKRENILDQPIVPEVVNKLKNDDTNKDDKAEENVQDADFIKSFLQKLIQLSNISTKLNLTDVTGKDKKSIATGFYAALSLHTDNKIVLEQEDSHYPIHIKLLTTK